MTSLDTATANADRAQRQLEEVRADCARVTDFVAFLPRAVARAEGLGGYYQDQWLADRDEVLAAAGEAVTPEALNEDAIYEALAEHDALMRRLLLAVARSFQDSDEDDEARP